MEKKTLESILNGKIFQIPDYQRGYAWEVEQWKDFVQDIDALVDESEIGSHYTGTIVVYQDTDKNPLVSYGTEKLELVEVVDGQQRLTTCSLYLSIIINELKNMDKESDYSEHIQTFLHSEATSDSKLRLNNDTADFYSDLVAKGTSNVNAASVHQKRIFEAYTYLKEHIKEQLSKRNGNEKEYLKGLFDVIIGKLNFSFYTIETESEIGMTFELMNSRGKDLSSMELLKNYLMYWVYRNIPDAIEKDSFTKKINKAWKEVYKNIAECGDGEKNENQCLKTAWILYVDCKPKTWKGYSGFKSDDVLPLRNFDRKTKEDVKSFLSRFMDGLGLISKHYSAIVKPDEKVLQAKEFELLSKIINAGNIATFLPLMVAVRAFKEKNSIHEDEYYDFLRALEIYSYRVFLYEGKRSHSGLSAFYQWAKDVFSSNESLKTVIKKVYGGINRYSPENYFRKWLGETPYDWYHHLKRLLKYTLFEYEIWLLDGKNRPKLKWEDLSDATIEHIFPQNPEPGSSWLKKWNNEEVKMYLHDISNLVLTKDNSKYHNFEFDRKKGKEGIGDCYANSDIHQERAIAYYHDWTPESCKARRTELVEWIIGRWGISEHYEEEIDEQIEDDENIEFDDKA